jgi:hypothetical protein
MEKQGLLKSFSKPAANKKWMYIVGAFLVVVAGVGTAWLLSPVLLGTGSSDKVAPGATLSSDEAGTLDPDFNYDSAVGVLRVGGIDNEGTHHLEREGGPTKTVYLTSSVIDLESFVGKEIEVWGETQAAKKASWLMDVAKVKLVK